MSVRATVLLGVWLVGLMSTELPSVGCCPVMLLSNRVTVRSGFCLSGKCPSGYSLSGMCPRGSVLRASVRIPFVRCSLCKILSEIVLIKLFTMDLYSLISCVPMRNRFTQECDCFQSRSDNYFYFWSILWSR